MAEEVALPIHTDCFACGTSAEEKVEVAYHWNADSGILRGEARFGSRAQGPPGHVHGGALASVLDEAMGFAAWLRGHICVAVNLNVNFRDLVPLNSDLTATAWVDKVEGRKVYAAARLVSAAGDLMTESTGLYIVVPAERIGNKLPGTLQEIPDHMRPQT